MSKVVLGVLLAAVVAWGVIQLRSGDAPAVPIATTTTAAAVPWTCREAMQALDLYQAGAARQWLRMCHDDLVRAGQDTTAVDRAITMLERSPQ